MADETAAPRRFYTSAAVELLDGGYTVKLDSRVLRTPRRTPLVLPTKALADLVASEWAGQGDAIVMASMPATRLAFTTLDRIGAVRAETVQEVVRYAASDLLCYLADAPASLVERQKRRWGAVLDWARDELELTFVPVAGIVHQAQPDETLAKVGELASGGDDFALAGLVFAAGLFGSAVLALALWRDQLSGDAAFELSRLDEAFQEERWGVDDEAAARTAAHRAEAEMLDRWFHALR